MMHPPNGTNPRFPLLVLPTMTVLVLRWHVLFDTDGHCNRKIHSGTKQHEGNGHTKDMSLRFGSCKLREKWMPPSVCVCVSHNWGKARFFPSHTLVLGSTLHCIPIHYSIILLLFVFLYSFHCSYRKKDHLLSSFFLYAFLSFPSYANDSAVLRISLLVAIVSSSSSPKSSLE